MKRKIAVIGVLLATLAAWGGTLSTAYAQAFPVRPVRIVVPGTGGSADSVARLVAQGLSGRLGQQVIVDNRPNGIIPIELVIKAQPDGYTILLYGSTVWLMPFLNSNITYDPLRDFAPISLAVSSPNIVVVPVSFPVKTIAELIALAKAKPGALNYGTTGTGNATHLAAELFKSMTGVNIVRINYKAAGTALTDLIGGQIQVMFAPAASVAPHLKAGKLHALAVTSAKPSMLRPDLPTVASAGLPGYESLAMSGIFAPAKTPPNLVTRLSSEIAKVLQSAEVRQKLIDSAVEPVGSTPQELTAVMKAEMARLGKVIRDAGIRDE